VVTGEFAGICDGMPFLQSRVAAKTVQHLFHHVALSMMRRGGVCKQEQFSQWRQVDLILNVMVTQLAARIRGLQSNLI